MYCYYNGIDKIAHERGFGPFYDAELRFSDATGRRSARLGAGGHGGHRHRRPRSGPRRRPHRAPVAPSCSAPVTMQSGEGRFRWFHCRPNDVASLAEQAEAAHGDVAWVATKEQMLDEHWFGQTMAPPVQRRAGRRRAVRSRAGELPRGRRLGPVRTGVPSRFAHVGRGECAARRVRWSAENGHTRRHVRRVDRHHVTQPRPNPPRSSPYRPTGLQPPQPRSRRTLPAIPRPMKPRSRSPNPAR